MSTVVQNLLFKELGAISLFQEASKLWIKSLTILSEYSHKVLKPLFFLKKLWISKEFISVWEEFCNCLLVPKSIVIFVLSEVDSSSIILSKVTF
jgi:hypothetical protein